jgi:hypothetical protein
MGNSRFFLVPNQREKETLVVLILTQLLVFVNVWISYLVLKTQVITRGSVNTFFKVPITLCFNQSCLYTYLLLIFITSSSSSSPSFS